jgi:hypothetical protein
MTRLLAFALVACVLLGARADASSRIAIVPLTADDDVQSRALAQEISSYLRTLIVGRSGPHRLTWRAPDPDLVRKLPACRNRVRCVASIGAEAGAQHVVHGTVLRNRLGFVIRLELVDAVHSSRVRTATDVVWQDVSDVTFVRSWVRAHYARLIGGRFARSS